MESFPARATVWNRVDIARLVVRDASARQYAAFDGGRSFSTGDPGVLVGAVRRA